MPASILIQRPSMFAGLGATPQRTELTEQQWTEQVNQQWAQANPDKARALFLKTGGANIAGLAMMGVGAAMFFMGQKTVGAVLGLGGAGIVGYGIYVDRTEGYNAASPYTVGSNPGV